MVAKVKRLLISCDHVSDGAGERFSIMEEVMVNATVWRGGKRYGDRLNYALADDTPLLRQTVERLLLCEIVAKNATDATLRKHVK